MDFDDEEYQEASGWTSSSESDGNDPDSSILAVTPYSRITSYQNPVPIARKTLLAGHRPPHDPKRELAILRLLKDECPEGESTATNSIIPLLSFEIFPSERIVLDFPLMQTDLKQVYWERKEEIVKDPEQVNYMLQRFLEILSALNWCLELRIVHRDVNPSNILLSNNLREPAFLSDFGIAWMEGYPDDAEAEVDKYSSGVGTGPYRAPELIFAPHDYGCEVDMWSFGCTVAELFTPKQTLFSDGADYDGLGSDLVLLGSVVSTLGTPTSDTWPETQSFRDWDKIQLSMKPALPRRDVLPWAPEHLMPWIFSMIAISASQRLSAKRALEQVKDLIK